jgi:hypothetical protein
MSWPGRHGQDPVAFRLAMLDKLAAAEISLQLAAEKSGWGARCPAVSGAASRSSRRSAASLPPSSRPRSTPRAQPPCGG